MGRDRNEFVLQAVKFARLILRGKDPLLQQFQLQGGGCDRRERFHHEDIFLGIIAFLVEDLEHPDGLAMHDQRHTQNRPGGKTRHLIDLLIMALIGRNIVERDGLDLQEHHARHTAVQRHARGADRLTVEPWNIPEKEFLGHIIVFEQRRAFAPR